MLLPQRLFVRPSTLGLLLGAGALLLLGTRASAQDWTPPTRTMPNMPRMGELAGSWRSSAGAWGTSAERLSGTPSAGMRATGDAAQKGDRASFVRFTGDARPVATWTDRNGDGKADLVELFRNGTVVYQVIDADYDGKADAVRHHDGSGKPTHTADL